MTEDTDDVVSMDSWYAEAYGNEEPGGHYKTPLIEGLTRETLDALIAAWDELPEDMLQVAFGDHASVTIKKGPRGDLTWSCSEYEHE